MKEVDTGIADPDWTLEEWIRKLQEWSDTYGPDWRVKLDAGYNNVEIYLSVPER